jgi:hypothetical protein
MAVSVIPTSLVTTSAMNNMIASVMDISVLTTFVMPINEGSGCLICDGGFGDDHSVVTTSVMNLVITLVMNISGIAMLVMSVSDDSGHCIGDGGIGDDHISGDYIGDEDISDSYIGDAYE